MKQVHPSRESLLTPASPSSPAPPLPIGQHLLNAGKLSEEDIPQIIAAQGRTKLLFGETAVSLGLTTESDVKEMLAHQYDYLSPMVRPAAFSPVLVAACDPYSQQSEAYRTLRTELTLRQVPSKCLCLTVTAGREGQGASVLAGNLAIVFAQTGARTLLIDANFRRSSQQFLFGVTPGFGLSGYLNGRCDLSNVLPEMSPLKDLWVLCAGAAPPNPQELLSRTAFSHLLDRARADFDVVIVDTPPILEYADARLVASHTGSCVLAVRRSVTRVADIEKARSALEPTGARLVGAAMLG